MSFGGYLREHAPVVTNATFGRFGVFRIRLSHCEAPSSVGIGIQWVGVMITFSPLAHTHL